MIREEMQAILEDGPERFQHEIHAYIATHMTLNRRDDLQLRAGVKRKA